MSEERHYDIANLANQQPEPIQPTVQDTPKEEPPVVTLSDIHAPQNTPSMPRRRVPTREEVMNSTREHQQRFNKGVNIVSNEQASEIVKKDEENKTPAPDNNVIATAVANFYKMHERKTQEAREELNRLREASDNNRRLIAEGIEEAPVEETLYVNYKNEEEKDVERNEEEDFDAALEADMREAEINASIVVANNNVKIATPSEIVGVSDKVEIKDSVSLTPTYEPEVTAIEEDIKATTEESFDTSRAKDLQEAMFSNATKIMKTPDEIDDTIDTEELKSNISGLDNSDFSDVMDIKEEDKTEEEEAEDKADEKQLDDFKSEILTKIVNVASNIDISTFKISRKVANVSNVLSHINSEAATVTDSNGSFALFNSGRPYKCSALAGPEIVTMFAEDDNSLMASTAQLQILYNHDLNPNKPGSLKAWCKSIPYYDLSNMYMAEYIATFKRANYLPRTCNECNHIFLENVENISDTMVKFSSTKYEERFNEIMGIELTAANSLDYEVAIVPITNNIAIGFKLPSIYNYLTELKAIPKDFLDKYSSLISTIMHIDTLYEINAATGELNPIPYKRYKDSIVKNFKSKMVTYSTILNKIPGPQYSTITAYMNKNMSQKEVSFTIPETKCIKCNAKIESVETTSKDLLFTQPRLVNIATISIE